MTTPNYQHNNPRGYGGDPRRGAAMGRSTLHADCPEEFTGTLYVARVVLDGDYDINGTYWGGGGNPLYWCASEDHEVDFVIRASDWSSAILEFGEEYPGVTVFTKLDDIVETRWYCSNCDEWPIDEDQDFCPKCEGLREVCEG